jgi:hypothetical protein
MNVIMTVSFGRNGIKIATARTFTEPRAAWEYALRLAQDDKTYNCGFYLLSSDKKAKKMKTVPYKLHNEEPWDNFPDFLRELEQGKK